MKISILFCILLRTSESKNVQKSVGHKLTLSETFGNDFEFFVMSDPQYGKIDQKNGGNATKWDEDNDNVKLMCLEMTTLLSKDKTAFLMVTGDLAEAYPVDEGDPMIGRLPGFRSAQLADWLRTMNEYCPELPILVTDGNHDIGNDKFEKHAWMGYEKQFSQLWYYFQASFFRSLYRFNPVIKVGQRYFIVIDSQVYKLEDSEALDLRKQQNDWLEEILQNELPKEAKVR